MFDKQQRHQLRQHFFEVYQKMGTGSPLSPLELEIQAVVVMHPEYHSLLQQPDRYLWQDFNEAMGQINPFLHMSGHLGLREQLSTDRPAGIHALYRELTQSHPDPHALEHRMMHCLMALMWQSQQEGSLPDDRTYLDLLRQELSRAPDPIS